ncbi:hypothetical protein HCMG_01392 [Helicobacter canadensis MIT 98-5491]|uniref:Conserved virulence protein n=1 Tax=Helicobacter canadensis MIT 98-5491 TaxID=537970 RepID=C5ZY49_9HELI|nr:conserved virulence protein [Helicobacter canadensis MIT 98-5491]EFR49218.1 hypothetical protein HCMG_01392 [Helicobacter canadensis MIT 98-5491]STP02430.1 DNA binding protein [Helicobacter canadensis]
MQKSIKRNLTMDFLSFSLENQEEFLEVVYKNDDIWLSVALMAKLFECSSDNIYLHINNIYKENELDKNLTSEEISVVQKEGKREVKRKITFYNLDAIISVGYRINSYKATKFRQWATTILKQFSIKGYVLDKERLKNGSVIDKNYFDELLELNRIVGMYLDYAEDRAKKNIAMTMQDWKDKLDSFLEFNEREILKDNGKISKKIADDFAKEEFHKFRVIQDKNYKSDFDKAILKALKDNNAKHNR